MPFDWSKYLILATELRQNQEEAFQRSAISRGYYSAFNIARTYLEAKQRAIRTDDHKRFWSHVRVVTGDLEIQTMGQRARQIRDKADYKCEFPKMPDAVATAMLYSTKIIYRISKLDRTPAPVAPDSSIS